MLSAGILTKIFRRRTARITNFRGAGKSAGEFSAFFQAGFH